MDGKSLRAALVAALLLCALAPASASADYNRWYLRNANTTGVHQVAVNYGDAAQTPLAGDWDGNGVDTPGLFRSSTANWWLANNFTGTTDAGFVYGSLGMSPVVGDWNGNGNDSVGVKTGGQWHVSNSNSGLPASSIFTFGNPSGDIPLAGDWDGNGTETPGLYRTSNRAFYLSNSPTGSLVSGIVLGIAGDVPVVGDWNGDGRDSIGVFRSSNSGWYLSNGLDGTAEIVFAFGSPGDRPVVGDWDGNGTDTPGVVRRLAGDLYPTSTRFGGENGIVDKDNEVGAVLTALGSAETDEQYNAIWNGLRPTDQAHINQGSDYEDDTLLRDESNGRVYLYATGAVAWVTNRTVADRLDLDVDAAIPVSHSLIESYELAYDITEAALDAPDEPAEPASDYDYLVAGHPKPDKGYFWIKPDTAYEENRFVFTSADGWGEFRGTAHWYRHKWNLWKYYVQWQNGSRSQALIPGICHSSAIGAKFGKGVISWGWPPAISPDSEPSVEGYTRCPKDDYTNAPDIRWGGHRPLSAEGKAKGHIKEIVVNVCTRETANSPRRYCTTRTGKRNGNVSD